MSNSTDRPCDVWELEFPANHSDDEKLRFLLNYAVLAPSTHNTQPWLWRVQDGVAELYADVACALPTVDPDHRELVMSCGAALLHLKVALRHFGYAGSVVTFPDKDRPELLARVALGEPAPVDPHNEALFWAMPRRHTNRRPYKPTEVPGVLLDVICSEARAESAWLHVVPEAERDAVVDLIVGGDSIQGFDAACRRELAQWLRPNHSNRRDGIPGAALGLGELASCALPAVVRHVDISGPRADQDRLLARSAPVLVVLGTDRNDAAAWLAAGQALARVLLRACTAGVEASFFNQPLEVNELWARLRNILGRRDFPQLMFRLGYATGAAVPTPRRSVEEVVKS